MTEGAARVAVCRLRERHRTERGGGVVIAESGLVLTHGHQADQLEERFR
jgi:hypothetical protein